MKSQDLHRGFVELGAATRASFMSAAEAAQALALVIWTRKAAEAWGDMLDAIYPHRHATRDCPRWLVSLALWLYRWEPATAASDLGPWWERLESVRLWSSESDQ